MTLRESGPYDAEFRKWTIDALVGSASVQEAARKLGIGERALRQRCQVLGLDSPSAYVQQGPTTRVNHRADQNVGTYSQEPTFSISEPELPSPRAQEPSRLQRVLIMPDAHIPYHDELCWETFLTVAREWRPDVLVILGDLVDMYQASQYPKSPDRKLSLADEIRLANVELDRISALRIPRVIYCQGNHETRLFRLLQAGAPALHGVSGLSDREQLRIHGRGWEWVEYGHYATIGKLHFMHDAGHAGVYAARQSVAAMGANVIFGHTHRAACHYESTVSGDRHVGWTMGWLGSPDSIDYRHRARVLRENQHGFGVAYVEDGSGCGWVHFVPILSGRAVVDGRVYSGRVGSA